LAMPGATVRARITVFRNWECSFRNWRAAAPAQPWTQRQVR
jgi:hypothetical protein